MKIGLQIPSFTWPGEAAGIRAKLARDRALGGRCRLRQPVGDGPFLSDPRRRPGGSRDAGILFHAGLPGGRDRTRETGRPGDRRDLPPPGAAGQDRDHAGCALGRSRRTSDWGLAGSNARRWGWACPFLRSRRGSNASRRRCRSPGRCGQTTTGRTQAGTFSWRRRCALRSRSRRPHPPILIGGMGERKTLRLVAQYADACNLFARTGIDTIRAKLDVLKRHCEKLDRDYAEIEKTTLEHRASGRRAEVVQRMSSPNAGRWQPLAFSTASSTCRTCTRSSRCASLAGRSSPPCANSRSSRTNRPPTAAAARPYRGRAFRPWLWRGSSCSMGGTVRRRFLTCS